MGYTPKACSRVESGSSCAKMAAGEVHMQNNERGDEMESA